MQTPFDVDHGMFTAVPTTGVSELATNFRTAWLSELRSLVTCCERTCQTEFRVLAGVYADLDPRRKWSPAVFLRIAGLRQALRMGEVAKVYDALARLQHADAASLYDASFRSGTILSEDWEWDFVPHMRQYEPKDREGRSTLVLPILGMDLARTRSDVEEALDVIARVDPLISAEYDELVTRIKYFQGRVLRGETNTQVFGAVFFRLAPASYNQLVYWVEHLVHEISHLRLELLRVHDTLVMNDGAARHRAPFRRDPRPMLGVFHATFVLARMVRVIARLADEDSDPIYRERLGHLRAKFEIGLETIRTSGDLSPLGRQVFESMQVAARG